MKKKLVLLAAGLGLIVNMNAQWTTPVSITGASFTWQHQVSTGDGSYYLFDMTRNMPRLIIDGATGNFGIGSTTPAARLHISCGNNEGILIGQYNDQLGWNGDGSQPGYHIRFAGYRDVVSNYTGARISALRTNRCCNALAQGMELAFFVSSLAQAEGDANLIEAMRINSNANVGIGTTIPSEKLDVIGNPVFGTAVERLSLASGALGFNRKVATGDIYNTGIYAYQFTHYPSSTATNDFLELEVYQPNGVQVTRSALAVNGSGNVLIGKTTQTSTAYKLDVAGKILADALDINGTIHGKEVKVDLNGWSDFVFHPAYKLKSLAEVEHYIQNNGHLPEIPSAKEVEKNGVNVGEMQAKLLEKVEELTLYSIEQNKQLQEQRQSYAVLESKLAEQDKTNAELQQQLTTQAKEIEQLKQLITQKSK